MKTASLLFSVVLAAIIPLLSRCFATLEERWQAFDEKTRQEVGVKSKDYYVREWGRPAVGIPGLRRRPGLE